MTTATAALLALLSAAPGPEQAFWSWFTKNADRIGRFQPSQEAALDDLQRELHRVDRRLAFAIGSMPGTPEHELVLSADGLVEAFPVVKRLAAAAPRIPGWKVTAFRPRMGTVSTIEISGLKVDPRTLAFSAEREGPGRAALILYLPRTLAGANPEAVQQAVYLLLDHALGEYDVETKVGGIDLRPMPDGPVPARRPFADLPRVVDALAAGR